jgi:hypothetical protein
LEAQLLLTILFLDFHLLVLHKHISFQAITQALEFQYCNLTPQEIFYGQLQAQVVAQEQ